MKALVVFYSRTGTTRKVANLIKSILKCDSEEIHDITSRKGIVGYILGGRDALFKLFTSIKNVKKNPSDYDLVIIGTPIWSFTLTPAIRSYINGHKSSFKKVAFFCTEGDSGGQNAFKEMEKLSKLKPIATLELKEDRIKKEKYENHVKKFVQTLISYS
ncbi:MAG: hypothetical protein ABH842_00475 [Candidatus Micrarchaeota archaeon]